MSATPSIAVRPFVAPLARRMLLTLCTAAGLTGLYGLYSMLVTPLVSPGRGAAPAWVSTAGPTPPPPENVRMAEQHLPSQPWAVEAKYQFRTAEAFVFANEWEPVENNQAVRFRPFAMIFLPSSRKPDEPPVTLVGEWAYLKFEKKFDVAEPDPGRVVKAALQGRVRVSGPENLVIDGRNFYFSEDAKKLYSDEMVTFQYGQHRGRGLGLDAFLIADETATQSESIAITGVQSVRLRKNVSMELSFPQGEAGDRRGVVRAGEPDEPIEISVRSTGSFEFDVEANVGTFSDSVRVHRPTGFDSKGKPQHDSLLCEQLILGFEPRIDDAALAAALNAADGAGVSGPDAPGEAFALTHRERKDGEREGNFRNLDTQLEVRRARARGKPGKPVVLLSEANNLTAYLSDLIYDVQTRVAALTSPERVHVVQGTSELRSPGVTLQHDEHGRLTSIRCSGPGWLRYRDPETNAMQLAAQWQRQLRKYSDPESGLDVVELEQQAIVRQPEQKTGLAADFIRLWMDPQDLRATRPEDAGGPRADRIRLQKMLALREVALVSPEMRGEAIRLEVMFEEPPVELPPPPLGRASGRNGERGAEQVRVARPDASNGLGGAPGSAGPARPAEYAVEEAAPDSSADSEPDEAPAEANPRREGDGPIQVYSDLIRVRVVQGKTQRESRMAEVWTEGNVEVSQKHGDDEEPLVLTGDKLHLENRSETDQVLHVSGAPAHIYDRGMHIEGRKVHLDRAQNTSSVDGAGLLQLPIRSGLNGETLEVHQLLDVWWKEKMTFDGQFARFFGDVRTVLNDSKMHCEDMEVKLTGRISFTSREQDRQVRIERVDCRDGVRFDSMEYVGNRLSEVRRGHVARFTLDQITKNTEAHGPGHIEFWRRGAGQRASLGRGSAGLIPGSKSGRPGAAKSAKDPSAKTDRKDGAPSEANGWEYTRVDFAGKSDGNIEQRFTKFAERVHVVYGPVGQPPAVVDPDKLPADGGWMVCDTLRIQQVPHDTHAGRASTKPEPRATEKPQGHVELLARGNVELFGRTFNAKADQVTYDESKGLYTLRSLGNTNATIYHQKVVGGDYDFVTAQEMKFRPADNYSEVIRSRIASGSR